VATSHDESAAQDRVSVPVSTFPQPFPACISIPVSGGVERLQEGVPIPPPVSPGDTDPLVHGRYQDRYRRCSIGAGYLVLVVRELTGLSQRQLARRVRTSQPSLARMESGNQVPTVKTLMRVANAAGFELLLGLREFDADPPRADTVDGIVLLGAILSSPDDDLADFVVLKEPSIFDGPRDTHEV
jgi:transcriptional regulator with XRE-family HTH domain